MKVTTPDGTYLGRVTEVVVDGYGKSTFAIISYGGLMGVNRKYAAVPWAVVAEMLESDRLLVDRSQLENAPLLSNAKSGSAQAGWRHAANSYWRVY